MKGNTAGFTFVELVVVISIFSILLLFSIPLFRQVNMSSGAPPKVSGLIFKIESLKKKAVAQNTDFFLYIDPSTGLTYVTDGTMDEKQAAYARQNGTYYNGDLQVLNLEFPENEDRSGRPDHTICFSRKGYSDRVLIHLRTDDREMTLKVGTFLDRVELFDRYVSYDDCI